MDENKTIENEDGSDNTEKESVDSGTENSDEQIAVNDIDLERIIEVMIFRADKPLSLRKMATYMPEFDINRIKKALKVLQTRYENEHGIGLQQISGGYLFLTKPEYASWLSRMDTAKEKIVKLSNAALETLAIIAFKQPITRAEVEEIRGVGSSQVINGLVEKNFVTIKGRSTELGAPLLYGTTKEFLDFFGLNSIKDLPVPDEL